MPTVEHFLDIIDAISRRDWKDIHAIGKKVAEEEKKKKHFGASHKILEAIDIAVSRSGFDSIGTISSPSSHFETPP